jgi:outer membrane protein assembly factor BamB
MASEQTIAETVATTPKRSRWVPIARLALAWVATLALLPYSWGRTLVVAMLAGWPEPWSAIMLVFGIAAVMVLTFDLSASIRAPWLRRWGGIAGIMIGWVIVNGVLIAFMGDPQLPWLEGVSPWVYFLPLFVLASCWVAWLAWMFYRPMRWQVRWGVLLLLLAGLAGQRPLLKVEGLQGDANKINIIWRWDDPSDLASGAPDADHLATSLKVDLTRTTNHDYPQFLGPQRLAVLPKAHLSRNWKTHSPRRVWERDVGKGWGAFAVVGNYAVTQEQWGPKECVICYRLSDGAQMWAHEDPVRYDSSLGGPGPRATPTIAGGRVYTIGATGLLNCLDGTTGKPKWQVNVLEDNNAENISHGVCGSPLLVGDLVLVSPTGRNGISLAAYHRQTGKRVWQAGKDQASYSSPQLVCLAGVPQILVNTSQGVTAHHPATGEILWSFAWTNYQEINCSQPIPNAGAPGRVFVGTGYGKGCALFQVNHDSSDGWSVDVIWTKPLMKTKFTTAVLYKCIVYGLDDGVLECLDAKTGKKRWKDGRYEHGQILLAGNLLLVQAENGEVVLVEPAPDQLRELGRFRPFTGKTWNNPALAGRYLLVRNSRKAACYELPVEEK